MKEKLIVCIGDIGERSRVYFGDYVVPGVSKVDVKIDAADLSKVVITVNAADCEIVQKNIDKEYRYFEKTVVA